MKRDKEALIKLQKTSHIEALRTQNRQLRAAHTIQSDRVEELNDRLDKAEAENKRLREAILEALEVMDEEPAKELLEQVLKE